MISIFGITIVLYIKNLAIRQSAGPVSWSEHSPGLSIPLFVCACAGQRYGLMCRATFCHRFLLKSGRMEGLQANVASVDSCSQKHTKTLFNLFLTLPEAIQAFVHYFYEMRSQ